jgi:hypothetical protein
VSVLPSSPENTIYYWEQHIETIANNEQLRLNMCGIVIRGGAVFVDQTMSTFLQARGCEIYCRLPYFSHILRYNSYFRPRAPQWKYSRL